MIKGLQAEWGTCFRTVSFSYMPWALASWKNLVAVGFSSGDITVLDAITGVCKFVLSNHTDEVNSLVFSLDGAFLVSGSDDKTINLWDIQTGGVVKTFHGHTELVSSVSISLDCAVIASGSYDHTIRLWDPQTGQCCSVIKGHSNKICSISFSPTNSQLLMSASHDHTIQQWGVNGHQVGSPYEGNYVALSSDGSHFVSWKWEGRVATVWNSDSGKVVAELQSSSGCFYCCCFSPDGKFIAGGVGHTICIWNITGSEPCLVGAFIGHTDKVLSLAFSSSLISSSQDKSIKFWQTGTLLMDSVVTNSESTPLSSAPIKSVSLQSADSIVISSDSDGVVKTWDILTGLQKQSFKTPAKTSTWRDAQLIDGRLIFAWLENLEIQIWNTVEGEHLQTLDAQSKYWPRDLRISSNSSQVFLLDEKCIRVWCIWTGKVVGEVRLEGEPLHDSLIVDGSRVWACLKDSQIQGWKIVSSDLTPVPLSNTPPNGPLLRFIGTRRQNTNPSRIENTLTGKEVFQLPGRYAKPEVARWDGRYLVAGYDSGEVLILDFIHMVPQ